AAEQGGRRRERVRARERDPSGRRPQGPADLRDHDPAVGRLGGAADRRLEAFGPPRAGGPARRARRAARGPGPRAGLPPPESARLDADDNLYIACPGDICGPAGGTALLEHVAASLGSIPNHLGADFALGYGSLECPVTQFACDSLASETVGIHKHHYAGIPII